MKLNMKIANYVACALVVAVLTGCGGGNTGTVTGTIQMDGQPLADATVTFYPQVSEDAAGKAGRMSVGITDASGKYELIYTRDIKGAEIGSHKVHISTMVESGYADSSKPETVPKQYNAETELTAEVKAGANTIDFLDLTSEGEVQKTPRY